MEVAICQASRASHGLYACYLPDVEGAATPPNVTSRFDVAKPCLSRSQASSLLLTHDSQCGLHGMIARSCFSQRTAQSCPRPRQLVRLSAMRRQHFHQTSSRRDDGMPNHYATLDLPTNASAPEIKKYALHHHTRLSRNSADATLTDNSTNSPKPTTRTSTPTTLPPPNASSRSPKPTPPSAPRTRKPATTATSSAPNHPPPPATRAAVFPPTPLPQAAAPRVV